MKFTYSATGLVVATTICSSLFFGSYAHAEADLDNIEEIVVFGQYQPMRVQQTFDQTSNISADMGRSVEQFPGLAINRNGPVTGVMQYRGLIGDRFKVNFGGSPIAGAGPNAMDSPLSHILPMLNTQVILNQGVSPVTTGTETISGSLSVEQPIEFSDQTQFDSRISAQYNENSSANSLQVSSLYQASDIFVSVTALGQEADDGKSGSNLIRTNSFYERSGAGIQVAKKFDDQTFSGSLKYIYTGASGTAALNMDIDFIEALWFRFNYVNDYSFNGKLEIQLYGNDNEHIMDNFQFRDIASPAMARMNTVDSDLFGSKVTWENNNLIVGFTFETQTNNSTITNPNNPMFRVGNFNDVERDVVSIFAEYSWEFDDKQFSLGLQPTQIDTDSGQVDHFMQMMNPNIGALVNNFNQANRDREFSFIDLVAKFEMPVLDSFILNIDAGLKSRAPSYTQMFVWFPLGISAGLADGNNYLGNLDLNEETAKQLNLALSYQVNDVQMQAQMFYSDVDDYIIGEPSQNMTANMISNMMSGRPLLQWQNTDARLYGWELNLKAKLSEGLRLHLQAGDVFAKNKNDNSALYRIAPRHLTSAVTYKLEHFEFSVQSELVASQDDIALINNETRSAGYGLINLESSYAFENGITLRLAVYNLLDKVYQPHLSGVNRVQNAEEAVGERLFAAGRDLQLGISYQF